MAKKNKTWAELNKERNAALKDEGAAHTRRREIESKMATMLKAENEHMIGKVFKYANPAPEGEPRKHEAFKILRWYYPSYDSARVNVVPFSLRKMKAKSVRSINADIRKFATDQFVEVAL